MKRDFFDLLFFETPEGELPDRPLTHILCEPKSLSYLTGAANGVYLGWGCKGPTELEGLVNKLKAELDDIMSEGKRKYALR